ncbi:MAG: hypothetical protein ACR2PR_07985 [Pseudohongiellaceae bacterium]
MRILTKPMDTIRAAVAGLLAGILTGALQAQPLSPNEWPDRHLDSLRPELSSIIPDEDYPNSELGGKRYENWRVTNRENIDATLRTVDGVVASVNITDPEYRTLRGVGVGDSFATMLHAYPDARVVSTCRFPREEEGEEDPWHAVALGGKLAFQFRIPAAVFREQNEDFRLLCGTVSNNDAIEEEYVEPEVPHSVLIKRVIQNLNIHSIHLRGEPGVHSILAALLIGRRADDLQDHFLALHKQWWEHSQDWYVIDHQRRMYLLWGYFMGDSTMGTITGFYTTDPSFRIAGVGVGSTIAEVRQALRSYNLSMPEPEIRGGYAVNVTNIPTENGPINIRFSPEYRNQQLYRLHRDKENKTLADTEAQHLIISSISVRPGVQD